MAAPKKKQPTKKVQEHRSFKAAKETEPFFVFRFNHQTVYWLALCGIILALGIWVMYLTVKVQSIYDQIDTSNMSNSRVIPRHR